jgi:hypothetical protein
MNHAMLDRRNASRHDPVQRKENISAA